MVVNSGQQGENEHDQIAAAKNCFNFRSQK